MGLEIPAEHKADTSGPVRSKSPPATAAPSVRASNGAGVPFLTGSRIPITDTSCSLFFYLLKLTVLSVPINATHLLTRYYAP